MTLLPSERFEAATIRMDNARATLADAEMLLAAEAVAQTIASARQFRDAVLPLVTAALRNQDAGPQ